MKHYNEIVINNGMKQRLICEKTKQLTNKKERGGRRNGSRNEEKLVRGIVESFQRIRKRRHSTTTQRVVF